MLLVELAKELKATKQQVIDKLKSLRIKAKDDLSESVVAILRTEFKKSPPSPTAKEVAKAAAKPPVKKEPAKAAVKPAPKKEPTKAVKPVKKVEVKKKPLVLKKAAVKPVPIEKKMVSPPAKPAVTPPAPPKPPVKKPEPPAAPLPQPTVAALKEIAADFPIPLKDLAVKLQVKPSVIIKQLLDSRIFVNINSSLDEETVNKVAAVFGFTVRKLPTQEEKLVEAFEREEDKAALVHRSPVVTFMGHVDHGKTSLLDAIRKTSVAEKEHGGITQHIGAYAVNFKKGTITFLDTPGHEAFTAMRARGADITDIVVLVVAADEGVMPQTKEAIDHARAAGVPIIVALNKIDRQQAEPDRVKKQLGELDLLSEDWGGKTITVGVSAKTGVGIDSLLEMILLEAEMLELKANPQRKASGVVAEAKLSKGRGPVATVIVQNGTLHLNDIIICGNYYGKVRAMFNDRQTAMTFVGPAQPAEILGLSGVPEAGEKFYVVEDERKAREINLKRQELSRQSRLQPTARLSLEDLSAQIKEGRAVKELRIILKADVQGSLEALEDSLKKISSAEVQLLIIHSAIGTINTSDVVLAAASNAVIIGFQVEMDEPAKEKTAKEGVDVRTYRIIYDAIADIRAALEGLLEPKLKKEFLGRVEVRQIFKLTKAGEVAGCFVVKGKINRSANIDVVRNGEVVFEGKLGSLKRFKDDVREVAEGFECGLTVAGFSLTAGDLVEAYTIEKIARKLE
ncbi:MAG: translation initiation factor IF-2 [Candidatus Omnitrophota bacterium]